MDEFLNQLCVVIASHLSNEKRIEYLIECLESLSQQTFPICVYLSISFDRPEIKEQFLSIINKTTFNRNKLFIIIRDEKTPQMRHFYLLMSELKKHKWIMFCDDDDTYEKNRVEKIAGNIYISENQCINVHHKKLAGLYESSFGKDHREHRHEYWCYCVNIELLIRFYDRLEKYPDIIDNKCCDVLFAEYLRRINQDYLYCRLEEKLYNYRVDNNSDSITGLIKGNQKKYTRSNNPPTIFDATFSDYVVDWNECLYENMDVYIHDVFLRTIVGCEMEYILRAEFRGDYDLLQYVDECHLKKIKSKYQYWKDVCNLLYDIPLS
jgi:hypothetical protein